MTYLEMDGDNTVHIIGDLTSENVSEIRQHLTELLYTFHSLVIDLNSAKDIDVTGFYMLYIFKKEAACKYKHVSISLDVSSRHHQLILENKLLDILDSDNSSLPSKPFPQKKQAKN